MYNDDYGMNATAAAGMGVFWVIYMIVMIAFCALMIFLNWRAFTKAGREGWKSLIPIYNWYTYTDIATGKPLQCFLVFIPCVGFVFAYIIMYKFYKSYGISTGMTILSLFIIPIAPFMIAFNNDIEYIGPDGEYYEDDDTIPGYDQQMQQNYSQMNQNMYSQPMGNQMNQQMGQQMGNQMNQNMYNQQMGRQMNQQRPMNNQMGNNDDMSIDF